MSLIFDFTNDKYPVVQHTETPVDDNIFIEVRVQTEFGECGSRMEASEKAIVENKDAIRQIMLDSIDKAVAHRSNNN